MIKQILNKICPKQRKEEKARSQSTELIRVVEAKTENTAIRRIKSTPIEDDTQKSKIKKESLTGHIVKVISNLTDFKISDLKFK